MVESKRVYTPTTDLLAEGARLAHAKAERYIAGTVHETKTVIPTTSETLPVSPEETASPDIPVMRPAVKSDRAVASVQAGMKDAGLITRGKDIDDTHIQSPFSRSRGNDGAWNKQQQEEDERARAVVPIEEESSIESKQKRVTTKGETQEEQIRAFVNSLSDGEILILLSKNGQKAYYRRDGDDLVGKKNNIIKTEVAWKRYQNGWTVEKKDDEDVSIVPSLKPDMKAPVQAAHDEKKEEEYTSGKVFAEQYLELHPPRAEAEVQLDDIIEKAETIDKKTSEQYGELFLGDMWVAKNSDGSEKRIFITAFPAYGMVDIREGADASKLREELQRDKTADGIIAGTIDLEALRNTLREDGYIREDHGSRSERNFLETEKIDSVHSPESPEQQRIDELGVLVGEYRMKYVREDVEIKSKWEKLRRVLGLKKDEEKRQYKEMYEKALQDLRDAEMRVLRNNTSLRSEEQRKGIEKLLRYYKVEEVTNLISAHDQCRMEAKSWPQKVVNSGRAIGEWYNKQSFKKKILIGSLVTLGVAGTGLAGGGALVGSSVLLIKKIIANAGLSVALDARADQKMTMNFKEQAQKEIDDELERIFGKDDEETPHRTQGEMWDHFDEKLAQSSGELSPNFERLVSERKLNGVKSVALGFGIVFGGGAVVQYGMNELGGNEAVQYGMDHLGGREAVDWTKEHVGNILGGTHATHSNVVTGRIINLPTTIEPESLPLGSGVDGLPPVQPDIQAPIEAGVTQIDPIDTFVDKDIIVEKGDSVWKIAGTLADRLHLEDAQRTHFIDALKDQYGDVRLKAGETINFSEYGVDKEFIEKALGRATSLTADQATSIGANDAKIAAFATSHPDVTLTNGSVDDLLHGNTAEAVSMDPSTGMIDDAATVHETGTGEVSSTGAEEGGIKSADIRYERDIVLGKTYNLRSYTDYFNKYPESFAQFRKIDGAYKEFIFLGNSDMQQEIKGKTFASLTDLKGSPLGKFIGMSQKMYGAKLGIPGSKEKVYEYMTRIAMLGIEHPKGAIRLPQSI